MDIFTKEKRSEIMRRVKSKDTGPEKKVCLLFHSLVFRFQLFLMNIPGKQDTVLHKYQEVFFFMVISTAPFIHRLSQ